MEKEIIFDSTDLASDDAVKADSYEKSYIRLKAMDKMEVMVIKISMTLAAAVLFFGILILVSKI